MVSLNKIKKNLLTIKNIFHFLKKGEFSYVYLIFKDSAKKILSSYQEESVQVDCYFKKFSADKYVLKESIDIVIPVYNGLNYLAPLFNSIEKNTSTPYRLIVINDCSSDESVNTFLQGRLEKHSGAIYINNEKNLGFVKSVNIAIKDVDNHFVILNTDVEVPPNWLERLILPILEDSTIASTTPFTNSGTIASFPVFLEDNDIFEGIDLEQLDSNFQHINTEHMSVEVPTGVGFCMGVNFNIAKEIGFFDEETFGKGYGEENDWCQRAVKIGYKNIIASNLFVYHKHGGSFHSEEKKRLVNRNYLKLKEKHPNYEKDVRNYIRRNPHKILRNLLVLLSSSTYKGGAYVLIDHALGGGSNIYSDELAKNLHKDENPVLILKYDSYTNNYKVHFEYKKHSFSLVLSTFEDVVGLLRPLNIREIILNELVSYRNVCELIKYIKIITEEKKCLLTIPIHDYFSICPNYTLLNDKGFFCDLPSIDKCEFCLKNSKPQLKNVSYDGVDIYLWRKLWGELFVSNSKVICFSNSSKELILKSYPQLEHCNVEVVPHAVSFIEPVKLKVNDDKSRKKTIGVLGAINYCKGSSILKELIRTIDKNKLNINVVLIGEISDPIDSKSFYVTGRYKRDELPKIVRKFEIDVFLIPSIWPETFSYTTQEIILMNMPIMVFDLGAPAERVKNYNKGIVFNDNYIENIVNYVTQY